jgi:hypothetical protein
VGRQRGTGASPSVQPISLLLELVGLGLHGSKSGLPHQSRISLDLARPTRGSGNTGMGRLQMRSTQRCSGHVYLRALQLGGRIPQHLLRSLKLRLQRRSLPQPQRAHR